MYATLGQGLGHDADVDMEAGESDRGGAGALVDFAKVVERVGDAGVVVEKRGMGPQRDDFEFGEGELSGTGGLGSRRQTGEWWGLEWWGRAGSCGADGG